MASPRVLTAFSAAISLLLSIGLWLGYFWFGSQLALAQAADSLIDVVTALVLAWAVRVASKPRDACHPFGHRPAEPLAGIWVAAMAAVLAYRVASDALLALWQRTPPASSAFLAAAFVAKAVLRGGLWLAVRRVPCRQRGPALGALAVDARNDTLLSLAAVLGAVLSRRVDPLVDPLLALPMALWIGWSGIELARDNVRLLMGHAPPPERHDELLRLARQVSGIRGVHDLRAQYVGHHLAVNVHVEVDPDLRIGKAHDLGEAVRSRLMAEPDVDRCEVHIDVAQDAPTSAPSGP